MKKRTRQSVIEKVRKTPKKRTRQRPRKYVERYTNANRNDVKLYLNCFEKSRRTLAKPKYRAPRKLGIQTLIPRTNNISALGLSLLNKDLIDRTHIGLLVLPNQSIKEKDLTKAQNNKKNIIVRSTGTDANIIESKSGETQTPLAPERNLETDKPTPMAPPPSYSLDLSNYRLHKQVISKAYLINLARQRGLSEQGTKDALVRRIIQSENIDSQQSLESFERRLDSDFKTFKPDEPIRSPSPARALPSTPKSARPRRLPPLSTKTNISDVEEPPKTAISDSEAYDIAFDPAVKSIPPLTWGFRRTSPAQGQPAGPLIPSAPKRPEQPVRVKIDASKRQILPDSGSSPDEVAEEVKEESKRPRPPSELLGFQGAQSGTGANYEVVSRYQSGKGATIPALYDSQISEMMKPYRSKGFLGVFASDEIDTDVIQAVNKTDELSFVMNLDKASGGGTHWVGVFIDFVNDKSVNYFDSFGDQPSDDFLTRLKKIIQARKGLNHYLKMKINMVPNQRATSQTCGYHAMNFLMDMHDGKSFKEATNFDKLKDQSVIKEGEEKAKKLHKRFGYLLT